MKRTLVFSAAVVLAGTVFLASKSTANPDAVPPAPPLSTADKYLTNTLSVTLDAPLDEARAFMRANPLTGFLQPSGRIPRIESVEVLSGTWGTPGALRQVNLEGGDLTHERVLTSDADEFTYQIWNITTSAGRFIDHIYGELRFVPQGNQTKLTWSYNVKPAVFFARPSIRAFLRDDFKPFMEIGLNAFADAHNRG